MAGFTNDEVVGVDAGRGVLRRLLAADALPSAMLDHDPLARDLEHLGGRVDDVRAPLAPLVVALLPAGVDLLHLQPRVLRRLDLEAVDDQRELGHVAVVDAIRVDVVAASPAPHVARVLREAMLEVGEIGHGRDCTKRVATLSTDDSL